MTPDKATIPAVPDELLRDTISMLARRASIEVNVHDLKDLPESANLLEKGTRVFVSFLPKQTWADTTMACSVARRAGFNPVPHIPVRLINGQLELGEILDGLVRTAGVSEALWLSGDYPEPQGAFACVEDLLSTIDLRIYGLRHLHFAGHPEGHPRVPLEEIRRAEKAKALKAAEAGLSTSLVTQFFFETEPFAHWSRQIRAAGVQARLVAGVAGPAKLSTLFKFALRCGVGASIRALGTNPTRFTKLLSDHGPEQIWRKLAEDMLTGAAEVNGIHLFCFGGYLRTCQWLHRVCRGDFNLTKDGFEVR